MTPTLVNFNQHYTSVPVQLSNLTTHPIVIPPGSLICQLQACEISNQVESTDIPDTAESSQRPYQFDFSDSSLSEDQKHTVRQFLADWTDVFSKSDTDIGFTGIVKHEINLTDDTICIMYNYMYSE